MNSMTGYGRCVLQEDGREMTLEVKSVNHRYLDLAFRMPRSFAYLEDTMRALIGERVSRGHVEVYITYRNLRQDARQVAVDEGLLTAYQAAMDRLSDVSGLENDASLSLLARLPDVLQVEERQEDQEALTRLTTHALRVAVAELAGMRQREGQRLAGDIRSHLSIVTDLAGRIQLRAPYVVSDYRRRLQQRVTELTQGLELDEARLTQEVALFCDRVAIDEELARLRSHVEALEQCLNGAAAQGRRMDFIVQEMNREVNTIGSKASDAALVSLVVDAKSEIEKIREQVQNIE